MIEREVVVGNRHGLHLRAATALVQCLGGFDAQATVVSGVRQADARSVLALAMLELSQGARALLRVRGADEAPAAQALAGLFGSNFGEE